MQRRVTQSDIAKKARVTQTSVSLAMRNHPTIPEATRKRIMDLAAKMGYRPDPMLSSLVAYRRTVRPASFQGSLAWVTNYPLETGWCNGQQIGYYNGAQQRAHELGYKLETVWLKAPGLKPDRIKQILLTRGIHGLLLAPQPEPHTVIHFDWHCFSAVSFGHTLRDPHLHLVMNHQFRNMSNLIRKLQELGYRKVGLAMPAAQDERVENHYLGGYLVEQTKLKKPDRLPHFMENPFHENSFNRWFGRHKPEVIITELKTAPLIQQWLRKLGCSVPRDVGLALPNVPFGDDFYSGIDENPLLVGASAVDVAVGMIHRNERGVPANPRYILIEGRWFVGRSVKR